MLTLAGASPLRAQDQGLYQVRVDSIVVSGVNRYSPESVRRIARLRVGDVVSGPDIQASIQRLFATGEFADIEVSVTPGTPAVFFIRVVERPVVGQYLFEGLEHANIGAIRDSAGLIAGTALDPSRVARARVLIRSKLSNAGFPQAVVDTTMTPDPSGLDQLDVTVRAWHLCAWISWVTTRWRAATSGAGCRPLRRAFSGSALVSYMRMSTAGTCL